MKICIVSRTFPPMRCGIGDYLKNLADVLCKKCDLIVLTSSEASSEKLPYDVYPTLNRWLFNPFQLIRIFESTQPDVLHIQTPVPLFWNSLAVNIFQYYVHRKYPSVPVVITLHEYSDLSSFSRLLLDITIRLSDKLIIVDPIYQRDIQVNCGLPDDKFVYIENSRTIVNPVDFKNSDNIRLSLSDGGKFKLMGFFGFIDSRKGLNYILDAMANLHNMGWLQTKLVVLGGFSKGEPGYESLFKNQIHRLGLDDYVLILGYLDNGVVNDYIMAMDYMNLPFLTGYSPKNSSMIAALSLGKPIITTLREGKKTLNLRGIYYLRSSQDVSTMSEFILKFQNDSEMMNTDYCSLDYSWDRNASEHLLVYNSFFNKK